MFNRVENDANSHSYLRSFQRRVNVKEAFKTKD